MLQEIYDLLHEPNFKPFMVRMSEGREYMVPTPDHAALNPKCTRLVIWTDGDRRFSPSALHIAGIGSLRVDN